MESLTADQQAFVRRHSKIDPFWGEVEDVSILSAALLTLGINPSAPDEEMQISGEPVSFEVLPDDLQPRLEVLRSAVRAGSLETIVLEYDQFERIDACKTYVRTSDFANWCDGKGIPHNLPLRPTPQPQSKWPWGNHETKLLTDFAAAADRFWKNYDPTDMTTAPRNKDVQTWLKGRGVSDRMAEIMATILRADGIPRGPR